MNRALIIGIDSTIGKALQIELKEASWVVYGTTRRKENAHDKVYYLDLSDVADFIFDKHVDVVYLCAALTNIEQCEADPITSKKINAEGPIQLIQYFLGKNIHVVYLSSNAVFNGERAKYHTTDRTCPITHYGRCKVDVEKELNRHQALRCTIVRLTKVFSKASPLILKWKNALEMDEVIETFHDHYVSPLSAKMVATCLKEIAEKQHYGMIHLSGEDEVSYQQFAEGLVDRMGRSKRLIKSKSLVNSSSSMRRISRHNSLDITESKHLFDKLDTSLTTVMNHIWETD